MDNKLKLVLILLSVFLVAFGARFFKIASYPVSLTMDEVSIGWNAYSILKTGKDEHNERLPLAFKSVGDYKPPVNIYLTVPSMALLGKTEVAVRLPTVLMGSLAAVFMVLLLMELNLSWIASVFGGVWVGLSPWHIHFSRSGFEAITALSFLLLGVWQFLVWIRKRNKTSVLVSITALSLSVWAYHAERVFVPLLVVYLLLSNKDKILKILKKQRKILLWSLLVLAIFAIPFLKLAIFTPAIKERALSTSILRETSLTQNLHFGEYASLGELVFNNDKYLVFRHWAGKYLNYFDLNFWFWRGMEFTNPGYLDLGLMYLVDLPIFFSGVYFLIKSKNRKYKTIKGLALAWFFLGPLPASMTMNEQHPLRALTWLPFFGLVVAFGVEFLMSIKNKWVKFGLGVGYIFALSLNFLYFTDIYLNQGPRFKSEYGQYGYKQIAEYTCAHRDDYDQFVISETFGSYGPLSTGIPYLYSLFYCDYDPGNFQESRKIPQLSFRRPQWKHDKNMENTLLIGSPWDFLDIDEIPEKQIVKRLKFLNGRESFILVETGRK